MEVAIVDRPWPADSLAAARPCLASVTTRETPGRVRVTNAERVALDGRELMANPTLRSVLLLGYQQIGDEVAGASRCRVAAALSQGSQVASMPRIV